MAGRGDGVAVRCDGAAERCDGAVMRRDGEPAKADPIAPMPSTEERKFFRFILTL